MTERSSQPDVGGRCLDATKGMGYTHRGTAAS